MMSAYLIVAMEELPQPLPLGAAEVTAVIGVVLWIMRGFFASMMLVATIRFCRAGGTDPWGHRVKAVVFSSLGMTVAGLSALLLT